MDRCLGLPLNHFLQWAGRHNNAAGKAEKQAQPNGWPRDLVELHTAAETDVDAQILAAGQVLPLQQKIVQGQRDDSGCHVVFMILLWDQDFPDLAKAPCNRSVGALAKCSFCY